ncbi:MAG: glycosyltransferase [Thermoanaerobaculia bacterium]
MITATLFSLLTILGTILTSIQALLMRAFRRNRRPFGRGLHEQATFPPDASLISILKPVCGLDDELEENLLSFVALRGIPYEVIISIEDREDPAVEVVQRVMRRNPSAPFRVIIGNGPRRAIVNRKVERLIAAARVARGEILFISDSNVRVGAEDIANTAARFSNPRTGCVSNIFIGAGAKTLGATIESLHLVSFVAPGAVLAASAGVPCVVGKSMAISRRALEAIGGFEAFRGVLAEDQAMGLAVKGAGFDVALSPVVVRNIVVHRSVKRALDRQIRWNKIRYSFSHRLYAAEILLNPLALAIVATLAGAPAALLPIVMLARFTQLMLLRRSTGAPLSVPQLCAFPILDLLMFYAWFVPFFSNRIEWRGRRMRIARGTELVAEAA